MGSFYSNISASNKIAFTFDRIYQTRTEMDASCATDGVFLNRYVLIEYDNPPITGYYSVNDGEFYGDPHYNSNTKLSKQAEQLYQDLNNLQTENSIYICKQSTYSNELIYKPYEGTTSLFAQSYNIDVHNYGRGYDSTVWMKIVGANGQTRYILIAELNTQSPRLHLVVDPPNHQPIAPYFDKNSTDKDYYIHMPTMFSSSINTAVDEYSDEQIIYLNRSYDNISGSWYTYSEQRQGDIFYNKAGFSQLENHLLVEQEGKDSINYTLARSGYLYYGEDNGAAINNGRTANDTLLWHIHLPSLGNTVAKIWNLLYTNDRLLQVLKEDFSNYNTAIGGNAISCTVDTDSVLGVVNTSRCYLGRVYALNTTLFTKQLDDSYIIQATEAGNTLQYNKMIQYIDKINNNGNNERTYFYPSYTNIWVKNNNGDYYYDTEIRAYKKANKFVLPETTQYYSRSTGYNNLINVPHWRLTKLYSAIKPEGRPSTGLEAIAADLELGAACTIYGALGLINRIMGVGLSEADSRDDRTVIGLMNQMTDIIQNIDTQLMPNKLLLTNNIGQITTSTITIPNGLISYLVLDNLGQWVTPGSIVLSDIEQDNALNTLGITNRTSINEAIKILANAIR